MKKVKTPSKRILSYIDAHLTYNPKTGIISKDGKKFGTEKKDGCIILQLVIGYTDDGCKLTYLTYAHQVAWYLAQGIWPEKFIDHINGQRSDNRLENLRLATPLQNSYNYFKTKSATSSRFKGVVRVGSKWRAYINHDGKYRHLGYYLSEEEAARAYDEASTKLHGEFGKLNFEREGCIKIHLGTTE